MYKHLMIATDGSDLAQHALVKGLELAQAIKARATVITVTLPWSSVAVGEVAVMVPPDDYDSRVKEGADKCLAQAKEEARKFGVECNVMHKSHAHPFQAIVEAAASAGADLIVVGSHGRSGLAKLFLGSETVKILSHSKIPVLVHRE